MSINERIKEKREELGLSQEELAILLGYKSRSTISKIESGKNDIPQSKVKDFARALNTAPSYLMGWDEKYNPNGILAREVAEIEARSEDNLPPLTAKDEREVAQALEVLLHDYDSQNALAAYNEPDDEEDRELLRASLENTMRLAKRMAKKKFTPKKYRKGLK